MYTWRLRRPRALRRELSLDTARCSLEGWNAHIAPSVMSLKDRRCNDQGPGTLPTGLHQPRMQRLWAVE